jgi:hypothetical protein
VAPSIETNISERRRNSRYRDQAKWKTWWDLRL